MKFRSSFLILSFLLCSPFIGACFADVASPNSSYSPTAYPTISIQAPVCGDGELDEGEDCDDGNRINGDGCDSSCKPGACAAPPGPNLKDATEQLEVNWIWDENFGGEPKPFEGPKNWVSFGENEGAWMWWPQVSHLSEDEELRHSVNCNASVMQRWSCTNDSWQISSDVVFAWCAGRLEVKPIDGTPSFIIHGASTLMAYTLEYTGGKRDKRFGSVDSSSYRNVLGAYLQDLPDGSTIRHNQSMKIYNSKKEVWNEAPNEFAEVRQNGSTTVTVADKRHRYATYESVFTATMKRQGVGLYTVESSERNEKYNNSYYFVPSGKIEEERSGETSTSTFGAYSATRKTTHEADYRDVGGIDTYSFAYDFKDNSLESKASSKINFHPIADRVVPKKLVASATGSGETTLDWNENGALLTPLDQETRQTYSNLRAAIGDLGGTRYWIDLP